MKKKKGVTDTWRKVIMAIGVLVILYPLWAKIYVYNLEKTEIREFYENPPTEVEKKELIQMKEDVEKDINNGEFNTGDPFAEIQTSESELKRVGIIKIPKISMSSPIYEGISNEVLDKYVGVMPKTNLPFGGKNTNSVLIAHRGTHDAELFRRLDEIKEGDYVLIDNRLSEESLAYKVTNIEVVLPDEGDKIKIVQDKDLITLVTCTPYLINSHRIIVTAERDLSYIKEGVHIDGETINIKKVESFLGKEYLYFLIFLILFLIFLLFKRKREKEKKKNEKNTNIA